MFALVGWPTTSITDSRFIVNLNCIARAPPGMPIVWVVCTHSHSLSSTHTLTSLIRTYHAYFTLTEAAATKSNQLIAHIYYLFGTNNRTNEASETQTRRLFRIFRRKLCDRTNVYNLSTLVGCVACHFIRNWLGSSDSAHDNLYALFCMMCLCVS